MAQRLVLIVVAVFVMDALWKAWALVALMLPMLGAQMLVQPFRRHSCNVFMALCYTGLLAIGAWEVGLAVYRDQGLVLPLSTATQFGGIIVLLTLGPFCIGCLLHLRGPLSVVLAAVALKVFRNREQPRWLRMITGVTDNSKVQLTTGGGVTCTVCQRTIDENVAMYAYEMECVCSTHEATLC